MGNLELIVTIATLIGVVLNSLQNRLCFLFWIPCNAVWVYLDWTHGLKGQAVAVAIMFVSAIYGWFKWGNKKSEINEEEKLIQSVRRQI